MSIFTADDEGLHAHLADAHGNWQENWSLAWHDPSSRCAGLHRIHLDPARNVAEVHTWVAVDGDATGTVDAIDLAAATDGGNGGVQVAELDVRTIDPLRSFAFTAGSVAELRYTAFTDSFMFSMSGQRVDPGGERYESFGTVAGIVRVGGQAVEVSASGFHRHAWGASSPGVRLVQSAHGVFGEDLFFSVVE